MVFDQKTYINCIFMVKGSKIAVLRPHVGLQMASEAFFETGEGTAELCEARYNAQQKYFKNKSAQIISSLYSMVKIRDR